MALAHPGWVYAAIWLVILGLFQLHLTVLLKPLSGVALRLVATSVGVGLLLSACVYALLPRLKVYSAGREARELEQLYRWRKWALIVWGIGSALEVVIFRGVPLIWLLSGDRTRTYATFGIPTVHGFLTALYFFGVAATAVEIFLQGRRRRWIGLLALLAWQVLLVNRGGLVWVALQIAGVFLICRRVGLRFAVGIIAWLLVAIVMFGVIGDVRTGAGTAGLVQSYASPAAGKFASRLPSGFLWVYVYTTTPLNNIVNGLENLRPTGTLFFSVQALLPTVIRERVFDRPDLRFPTGLVNPQFNTSTWFANFLADFGPLGAVVASALFLLVALLFYRPARAWRPWAIVGYSACFQGIVLSAFADTFTSLVNVAQLMLAVAMAVMAAIAARGNSADPASEVRGTATAETEETT